MSIDLPIEPLMTSINLPPMLFYAVAGVMCLQALRHLWGYVVGFVVLCAVATHPAEVNSVLSVLVQTATQLAQN